AGGGRREFGELVRRHGSAVRGLLRRMGAQPAMADDVAQDAFLLAFEKCAEFRGEGTFAAWIKRIAARLYLKRISKEARYVAENETEHVAPVVDSIGRVDLDEAL
ncbi:MAG TPA: RNA polymerase subunit sigma-70, partial [Brevundimonas sp.]|nr:RNA polymerase subunit sigma-70 [Brevundimonas sp.]